MRKLLNRLLSYIPTALPSGMTEFETWQTSILSMSKVPDNDSTRFALAVMILHLGSTEDRKAKQYFIRALNKGAANELANAVAMGIKEKQQARIKAEQESTLTTGAPNGSSQAV